MSEPDDTITTGKFRALRTTRVAGVECTEYEAVDTARYELAGQGHPEQPPELVRVWAADVDD